ncbi:MAG TPA: plasmid mobilization relaxosome protein MobC [Puia sp.]
MEKTTEKRTKWLTIRMTETEYLQVEKLAGETACQTLSEYARKVVLGKPIVMRYRNQSLDDFLSEILELRHALDNIGSNFNQAVRRLYSLRQVMDLQEWIVINEQDKTRMFQQIETISQTITQTYQLWSHE